MTEESIWKRVALGSEFGFGAMHYDYACSITGGPLINDPGYDPNHLLSSSPSSSDDTTTTPSLLNTTECLLHSTYSSSYRLLFRSRPRLRFGGCYISTVNYTRAGGNTTNTLTWGAPVHVVTYFRYLRFFRDGSLISLLTTSEPVDVVHHLTRSNMHAHHSAGSMLPSAVMKDALRGRWRLSSPSSSCQDEVEGELFIETEGVTPKYTYHLHLALGNAGKGARNNKLAWKGFWSRHRITDDVGEFALRNDRAFYWSRVRSFGVRGE
jgi:F-box protein 9